MNDKVKVEHMAVEIVYNDRNNDWVFTVGGQEYKRPSLNEAKEKINDVIKAIRLKARKQFEPINAFTHTFKPCRITSTAGKARVWHGEGEVTQVRVVVIGEPGASKESITSFIRDTPANRELMSAIQVLKGKIDALKDKLTHLTNDDVPEPEE